LTLATGLSGLGVWCRLTPDSFTYLDAARCLYETGGFTPMRMVAPPGFPMLLAPLMAFGDLPLLAVRWMSLLCWLASVLLTYLLLRRHVGTGGAWVAAALLATSPAMTAQSTALLSEMAFLPFILACLLLIESPRWTKSPGLWYPIVLGLICASATLVRTMGIVLAPILAIALFVRPDLSFQRRAMQTVIFMATFAAPLAAWELRQAQYPQGNSYSRAWQSARPAEQTESSGLALQGERLAHFGPMRLRDIRSALVPPHLGWRLYQGPAATISAWFIGGLMMAILLWRCWAVRSPIDYYALATMGMLCLWPYVEGTRMVVPLLPIFFAYMVWAARRGHGKPGSRRAATRLLTGALALLLVVHFCELAATRPSIGAQQEKSAQRVAAMQRIADWQDANLPAEASPACVIRPRDDAKTLLLGGNYLARRRIGQTLEGFDALKPDVQFCFAHIASIASDSAPSGWTRMGDVEHFRVFRRVHP
jgi:4-amino-4-deoxy-L-arabinose transferase-like glycosyltransferase